MTVGQSYLAGLDRRLAKARVSPADARFLEARRLWRERWKEGVDADELSAFTALELSLELQLMAAQMLDEAGAPAARATRRRIEATWKVLRDLDLVRKEARDPRSLLLLYVEEARETDLDLDRQVRFVLRHHGAIDADFTAGIDENLLRRLIVAWSPKRGRPKASAKKPDDPFGIGAALIYGATGVKVDAASLRKHWNRGRASLRKTI